MNLRTLQVNLPWSVHYSMEFKSSPMPHKDFAHALLHVHKAGGNLAALVDMMDHDRATFDAPFLPDYKKYLADLVICAMRMANTFPGGMVDLEREVIERLESKNNITLPKEDGDALDDVPSDRS
jgi:hypothetical protein